MTVRLFGVRHHGPGSARAVRDALESWLPDAVLVEGPPEADAVLRLAALETMRPPVALLAYVVGEPRRAAFWPFASWSPEWVAVRHALAYGAELRMIDLPAAATLARQPDEAGAAPDEEPDPAGEAPVGLDEPPEGGAPEGGAPEGGAPEGGARAGGGPAGGGPAGGGPEDEAPLGEAPRPAAARADPIGTLARLAGYDDPERWWDDVIEHRGRAAGSGGGGDGGGARARSAGGGAPGDDGGGGPFEALAEAIAELRASEPEPDLHERRREAAMRQAVRHAERQGFERIAVVCGAWHVPAIAGRGPARPDSELLAGMKKEKIAVTWAPWSHARLARASGYGAGVTSPGWYEHLFDAPDRPIERWFVRIAALLRAEGLPASPASVVEAVRLAEALAALRGRPLAGLSECDDAARAVLAGGSDLPLTLVRERLVIGLDLGEVPPETPMVPVAADLAATQRRLRLQPRPERRELDLDLRNATDLARSHLLHRLALLGIGWAERGDELGQTGTFHERWSLSWEPEHAVQVIEASLWGVTVESAASARAAQLASEASGLAGLTALVEACLYAELPEAVRRLTAALDERAAHSGDVAELLEALPPLARALRYGNVRRTDAEALTHVVGALVARASAGIVPACASLDDDAARAMTGHVSAATSALAMLSEERWRDDWFDALGRVSHMAGLHGLLAGRVVRILLDAGRLGREDASARLSVALSPTGDAAGGAGFVEGLLGTSAMLLVHDRELLGLVDDWVGGVGGEAFDEVLPLLRRTFSLFEPGERRLVGDAVRALRRSAGGRAGAGAGRTGGEALDPVRAAAVLPRVLQLLGVEVPPA